MKYWVLVIGIGVGAIYYTTDSINRKDDTREHVVFTESGVQKMTEADFDRRVAPQKPEPKLIQKQIESDAVEVDVDDRMPIEDIERSIQAINEEIEGGQWVERANSADLSPEEMLEFRKLLRERNKLFELQLSRMDEAEQVEG